MLVKVIRSERRNFRVLASVSLIVSDLLVNYLGVGYIYISLKHRLCCSIYLACIFRTTVAMTIFWAYSSEEKDFNFSAPSVQNGT